MRATPVDLIGGYYKASSLPWACQDTVNWLPVAAEVAGTRTVSMLRTPPGLKPYQQIGSGPIRGVHDCEGLRLAVSGRFLYRITAEGIGQQIGIIPGIGRVSMTHNQFKTGYQVLIENGQGGGGYVYNTTDGSFARITDNGYPGSISSDYLDSYLLGVEPQGKFWFHSNLADATDYNTLDRYQAESAPDRIVGLAVSRQEVVVFGERTTEFFMNTGAAQGTFQNRNAGIDRGCASRHTIQKLDNTLFWLGDDGIVYRLEGYAQVPVSTRALDQAIAGFNRSEAIAFVWEDQGHKCYYLTFPGGQTFGYDVVTRLWHRRESFGLDRWRLANTVRWGGKWYGGDFQDGRIWEIAWGYHLEGEELIISERASGVLSDNQSPIGIPSAELIFDTGQGPGTIPVPFPVQPAPPILGGPLPGGYINNLYSYTIPTTGGLGPFTYSVTSGSLPPGLSLQANTGLIFGTTTAPFSGPVSIRVVDSQGLWDERSYQIRIFASIAAFVDQNNAFQLREDDTYVIYSAVPFQVNTGTKAMSVSATGRYLAAGTLGSAGSFNWAKLNEGRTAYLTLPNPPAVTATSCSFSPDESMLAITNGTTISIYLVDRVNDTLTLASSAPTGTAGTCASWRQDSRRVIVGTSQPDGFNRRTVYAVDAAGIITGRYSPASNTGPQTGLDFSWSPDMQYAVERNNIATYVWRITDTTITLATSSATSSGRGAFFSGDGKAIFVIGIANASVARRFSFSNGVLGPPQPTTWQNAASVADSDISTDRSRVIVAISSPAQLASLVASNGDLVLDTAQPPIPSGAYLPSVVRWARGRE